MVVQEAGAALLGGVVLVVLDARDAVAARQVTDPIVVEVRPERRGLLAERAEVEPRHRYHCERPSRSAITAARPDAMARALPGAAAVLATVRS